MKGLTNWLLFNTVNVGLEKLLHVPSDICGPLFKGELTYWDWKKSLWNLVVGQNIGSIVMP